MTGRGGEAVVRRPRAKRTRPRSLPPSARRSRLPPTAARWSRGRRRCWTRRSLGATSWSCRSIGLACDRTVGGDCRARYADFIC